MNKTSQSWHARQSLTDEELNSAREILSDVLAGSDPFKAIRLRPLQGGGYVPKHKLLFAYKELVAKGELPESPAVFAALRVKPTRSLSGVATVTALTGPNPCPGHCIFCPQDEGQPKSYISDEPGAARAAQNQFDPFKMVTSRLDSYRATGHPIDKIELLILGGSWSAYSPEYREWFVKRCFDALNGCDSATLEEAQRFNEDTACRNVGLVVETRPDMVTPDELAEMRRLGVTKVQMGAQSFDDRILELNCRGHNAADTLQATALLRAAGFKTVLHWMPNLLGATPDTDREDFGRMWSDGYWPDELKIYPTQLLQNAPLYAYWQRGEFQPYSTEMLINLIADLKPTIPPSCRVNRVVRDIPAHHIMAGSKRSSLRQDIHTELTRRGQRCRCVRCREIRAKNVDAGALILDDFQYQAAFAREHFINFHTADDQLVGYLRLCLPDSHVPADFQPARNELFARIPELRDAALIREVHVYGQALKVGAEQSGAAQHSGLGSRLIEEAVRISAAHGYKNLAVISAVGTRLYYEKRGFARSSLYMLRSL